MQTSFRAVRAAVFGLGVALSLGFGTVTTTAEPARVPTCQDPGADGSCGSNTDCANICQGPGSCNRTTFCCYCLAD